MTKNDNATVGYVNAVISQAVKKLKEEKVAEEKPRMQFSQKVCVFGLGLVTVAFLMNFVLLWFGREPMSDVVLGMITTFGGFATGGYFALSGVRDCSRNKHADKLNGNVNKDITNEVRSGDGL